MPFDLGVQAKCLQWARGSHSKGCLFWFLCSERKTSTYHWESRAGKGLFPMASPKKYLAFNLEVVFKNCRCVLEAGSRGNCLGISAPHLLPDRKEGRRGTQEESIACSPLSICMPPSTSAHLPRTPLWTPASSCRCKHTTVPVLGPGKWCSLSSATVRRQNMKWQQGRQITNPLIPASEVCALLFLVSSRRTAWARYSFPLQ